MQNQCWVLYLGLNFSEIVSFLLLFVLHFSVLYNKISGMLLSLEL